MAAVLYRYTSDLRIDAHRGLAVAAEFGPVLPVFVVDTALERDLLSGRAHMQMLIAAVDALSADFERIGRRLVVRRGPAGATLRRLSRAVDAHTVVWSARYDAASLHADARLQADLEEAGLRVCIVHDLPTLSPEAMPGPIGAGYLSFPSYFAAWDKATQGIELDRSPEWLECDLHPEPLAIESRPASLRLPDLGDPRGAMSDFLAGPALSYGSRAKTPAVSGTSRLGPVQSVGRLGAHECVHRVRERLREPLLLTEERASLHEFLKSFARRDFFFQLAWFHQPTNDEVLQKKMRGFPFGASHPHLDRWRHGTTGFPLVDAGMRQLRATGWMHPYVRRVVASFLCFDLGVDWRVGREEFSRYAIDDEPALATGNWQWVAGVGADLAQFPRIFNPHRQRVEYDPEGLYVRQWIPELENEILQSRESGQLGLPLFGERTYPEPIHDHNVAARAFLARYRAYREQTGA